MPALDLVGAPQGNITRQQIEVAGFGGGRTHTLGFVNVDLAVGPIQAAHQFQVITQTAYHFFDVHGSTGIKLFPLRIISA